MKIPFDKINEMLEDPFFELRTLGKEAVVQRIAPITNSAKAPCDLYFVDWLPEDLRETIRYSFHDTTIGRLLLAETSKGLCFLGFAGGNDFDIMNDFIRRFPGQPLEETAGEFQRPAAGYCDGDRGLAIPLHLKGTGFQLGIWKRLVSIPEGRLATYGSLTDDRNAVRAVGSAVGANPVSYIIPCHRIVKSNGDIHGYHWGDGIKKQLLAYELQQ